MKVRFHEVDALAEFENKIIKKIIKNGKTYLYLDLDQTVMTTRGLGGDIWFYLSNELASEKIKDKKIASALVLSLYNDIQQLVHAEAVEPKTAEIINRLQDEIKIIPVTARGPELKETTLRQLKEIGIVFNEEIIFCGGKNKGKCVEDHINNNHCPEHLVALDDKEHHVKAIGSTAEKMNIEADMVRYTKLDGETKKILETDQTRQEFMNQANKELAQLKFRLQSSTLEIISKLGIKLETVEPDAGILKKYYFEEAKQSIAPIIKQTNAANEDDISHLTKVRARR